MPKTIAHRTTAAPLGKIAKLNGAGAAPAARGIGAVSRASTRLAPTLLTALAQRQLVGLSILQVTPDVALERRPMSIRFSIVNNSGADLYGTVRGVLGAPDFVISTPIRNGETRSAELQCTAPDAGIQDIELAFFARPDASDLGTPAATSGSPASIDVITLATAARYRVSFDSIHIDRTRAVHNDTDLASLSVAAGSGAPLTAQRSLGDVNDGDHPVMLDVGPFDIVPGSADDLAITYMVVNAGHAASTAASVVNVLDKVSDGTEQWLDKAYPAFQWAWKLLNDLTHWINEHLNVDCDGVVVSDKIVYSSATVASLVPAGGSWHEPQARYYAGTDSAVGCGANSKYYASFSIHRPLN